ncbi:MAG: YjbH domain-containing protein [Halomonas sp.]
MTLMPARRPLRRLPQYRCGTRFLRLGGHALCAASLLWATLAAAGAPLATLGGGGVWTTPSARVVPSGQLTLGAHYASPNWQVPLFYRPAERLEIGLRASQRLPRGGEARRDHDPQLDLKWRLWDETARRPALAIGVRDAGHVGPFSAEYLVASKRWGPLDVSLGLGWGALGGASQFEAPFETFTSNRDRRPEPADTSAYDGSQLLKGPAGLFGGVVYQTGWAPLSLALEYSGADSDPLAADRREPRSRWQGGARLALSEALTLLAGWERGETLSTGLSYRLDLSGQPARAALPAAVSPGPSLDWATLAARLEPEAGLRVHRLQQKDDDLVVVATPRWHDLNASVERANALLHAQSDDSVRRFRYRWEQAGMTLREDVHDRQAFAAAQRSSAEMARYRQGIYAHALLSPLPAPPLYQATRERFSWSLRPRLEQNAGQAEQGYRYRLAALAEARYETPAAGWFAGGLEAILAENLTRPPLDPLSDVAPNRRLRGYHADTTLGLSHLYYAQAAALGGNWYGMAYGGWLESQYAGLGGELLYRPFATPWAWGGELTRVHQRDFDGRLGLADDERWTGRVSAFLYPSGDDDLLLEASLNRYLGGDSGLSLGVVQTLPSGVSLGLEAAFSNARDHQVTPTLSLSVPFAVLGYSPRRGSAELRWQRLDSDSGSVLERRERLFELTQRRWVSEIW